MYDTIFNYFSANKEFTESTVLSGLVEVLTYKSFTITTITGVKLMTVTAITVIPRCILNGTCIDTIVIYELSTRKSQITTEKCI